MGNQRAEKLLDHAPAGLADEYARDGFAFRESVFTRAEIAAVRAALPEVTSERTERTVFEVGGKLLRSVYGVHQHHRVFAELARHPRILNPARQIFDQDVYVYQSKLNSKAVFGGDAWPWHQDYVFWRNEDSMPAPRAMTVAVFLDDVTDVNGPISLVPGSHRTGVLDFDTYVGPQPGYEDRPSWIANVVVRLKYTIAKEAFVRQAITGGIVTPKGPAGSVLFFDCNVAHASPPNLSPYERTIALVTYNTVDNAPPLEALHRPEFLVSRDSRPVTPVDDDVFSGAATPT